MSKLGILLVIRGHLFVAGRGGRRIDQGPQARRPPEKRASHCWRQWKSQKPIEIELEYAGASFTYAVTVIDSEGKTDELEIDAKSGEHIK